jgi:hypothetical protein
MENIQRLPMSTKVNLFTFMFSGLSSGFEILQVLSSQILRHICQQYQLCPTEQPTQSTMASQLLLADEAFFFNNLFAKLRYFGNSVVQTSNSTKHLLLVLKSLRTFAKDLLQGIMKELFTILCENMDKAMVNLDSN